MNIACIDDNDGDLFLLKNIITENIPNVKIHSFRYLNDFLETNKSYDLIIADLGLPDAYGPEVICRIRELTGKPIIVLTGVGGNTLPPKIADAIKNAGATIFLSKHKEGMRLIPQAINQFI